MRPSIRSSSSWAPGAPFSASKAARARASVSASIVSILSNLLVSFVVVRFGRRRAVRWFGRGRVVGRRLRGLGCGVARGFSAVALREVARKVRDVLPASVEPEPVEQLREMLGEALTLHQ